MAPELTKQPQWSAKYCGLSEQVRSGKLPVLQPPLSGCHASTHSDCSYARRDWCRRAFGTFSCRPLQGIGTPSPSASETISA
jgi:hypothetical protein